MKKLTPSELILNDDGSVYHLHLLPEHVADTVITVGDQNRAKRISELFDDVEYEISNREFSTYTGVFKSKRLSVCSTGIGTDNIDIFLNELDAAVNIDLKKRELKKNRKSLNIIRIGTSGSIQGDIKVGSFVASEYGVGSDNLAYYYQYPFSDIESSYTSSLRGHLELSSDFSNPYVVASSRKLMDAIGKDMTSGMTFTATGFYAPQGRSLRAESIPGWIEKLQSFRHNGSRITNFEMETSGLYTLSNLLGHHCLSCSVILANRENKTFADRPQILVDSLIHKVLNALTSS